MNHDFEEDELERGKSRRSHKRPSMKDASDPGLQVGPQRVDRRTAPSPIVRMRKEKSEKAKRKKRMITLIIAECFALIFIFGYAFLAKSWNLIQRPDFDLNNVKTNDLAVDTVEKMKGYWTIAIYGVDDRGKVIGKGTNADVNMICNINQDTGEIRLVSVFRDSYLNISDDNSYNKINQSYFLGGPEQAVKALNKNLDLDITDYVTFNWKGVADAINILGGVDIELSKAEFSYINSFITETQKVTGIPTRQLKQAGMNHLDGVQAVAYGRLRLMDTDFARTERQRKVIEQAFEKAKKADWAVLNNVMVNVFPQVATSIDMQDIVSAARNVTKYHLGENGGFPFARGDANMGKKGACVIPQTLETNVTELHKFLFDDENYVPTDTVKTISAKISSDTGMYKQGKSTGHVSTEGGVIGKPKESAKQETKESSTEETSETISGEETSTDIFGRPIGGGNGLESRATDEYGEPIDSALWGTHSNNTPGSGSANESTALQRPGESTSSARPNESKPTKPATTLPSGESGGPGANPTLSKPDGTAAESTAPSKPGTSPTESTMPTVSPVPIAPGGSTNSPEPGGNSGGIILGPGM